MQTTIKKITPELAREMLSTSNGNRPLKAKKVQSYKRDMEAGRWKLNGETIIFDWNGSLIDGHHRLTACATSGACFDAVIVTGAPPDAQKTIDMGASRTSGDALNFYGYRNANNLNAIVRVLLSLQQGRSRSANPSTQEVFEFVEANPGLKDAATFASSRAKAFRKVNTMLGAIYFIEAKNGCADLVCEFADVLASGIPSYPGCAAHALRERLVKDELSRAKVTIQDRQALILAAWDKFKVRAPVKTLKPKSGFSFSGFTKKEET